MESTEKIKPEKLNSDLIGKIAGYIRVGADFHLAAAACGIDEKTSKKWETEYIKAGANDENTVYYELYAAIRTATAMCEVLALQRLASEGGINGARWLLDKLNKKISDAPEKKKDPSLGCQSAKDLFGSLGNQD